jgi:hypothetical protein
MRAALAISIIALALPLSATITVTSPTCPSSTCPSASVGTPKTYIFQETGGTGTITWSCASGSTSPPVPPGMSLIGGISGTATIQGTPTATGSYTCVVQAEDSTTATGQLTRTIPVTIATLTITNTAMPSGTIYVMYNGLLQATGGVPPYTWSYTGSLPPGSVAFALNSSTGAITGTPNTLGTSTPTFTVTDSATPTPNIASLTPSASNIVINHTMWTEKPTSVGWTFEKPPTGLGSAMTSYCRSAAISSVDTSGPVQHSDQFPTMLTAKYSSKADWAAKQGQRLLSYGFTNAGQYSYDMNGSGPANGVPNTYVIPTLYYLTDARPYHIKNLYYNVGGQVCGGTVYGGARQPDPFDPATLPGMIYSAPIQFAGCGGPCITGKTDKMVIEEGDVMFGFDAVYPGADHQDMGAIVLDHNPALAISDGGYSYPDQMVYAKYAMMNYLGNEYGCTGSPDPAAPNYCGSGPASTALTALNAAWGTSYTTLLTSDPLGIPGIHSGAYSSYGTGTGLLDERGTHTIATPYQSSCQIWPLVPWASNAQIQTDMHAFIAFAMTTLAQDYIVAYSQPSVNPHPPMYIPIYSGPSYVYAAAAPYFDGIYVSANHPETATPPLTFPQEVQRIIAASSTMSKSTRLYVTDYSNSSPDSFYGTSTGGQPQYPLQQSKGAGIASYWNTIKSFQDVNAKYVITTLEHWAWYDQVSENFDGGVITAFADNPYDGGASIVVPSISFTWLSLPSTVSAPQTIWDGTNWEALSGNITTTCVKGASVPTWGTQWGQATSDGTCLWRNEGSYTIKPEQAARIPGTAAIPGQAYGDMITPLSNFLKAGICDPTTGSPTKGFTGQNTLSGGNVVR